MPARRGPPVVNTSPPITAPTINHVAGVAVAVSWWYTTQWVASAVVVASMYCPFTTAFVHCGRSAPKRIHNTD
eukprot:m.206923 g.206923  ORF g.206923 m.206923 type:complete len:73 (-) comp15438_c0_seq7:159-377(-)